MKVHFKKINIAQLLILIIFVLYGQAKVFSASPSPKKGGPMLYIDNKMRSKIYVRDIPTQHYGKQGSIIYYSPAEFRPLESETANSHNFFFNQWFGCPGSQCGKITLINDDPSDPFKWDNPLIIEMNEKGIINKEFKPNELRDKINKKAHTLGVIYNVIWNSDGWRILLKDKDLPIKGI